MQIPETCGHVWTPTCTGSLLLNMKTKGSFVFSDGRGGPKGAYTVESTNCFPTYGEGLKFSLDNVHCVSDCRFCHCFLSCTGLDFIPGVTFMQHHLRLRPSQIANPTINFVLHLQPFCETLPKGYSVQSRPILTWGELRDSIEKQIKKHELSKKLEAAKIHNGQTAVFSDEFSDTHVSEVLGFIEHTNFKVLMSSEKAWSEIGEGLACEKVMVAVPREPLDLLHSDLSDTAAWAMRFSLQQKEKVRVIDDFSTAEVYQTTRMYGKLKIFGIEDLAALLAYSLDANGDRPHLRMLRKTIDLSRAYKPFRICSEYGERIRLATCVPSVPQLVLLLANSLIFGATGSVAASLYTSMFWRYLGMTGLKLAWTAFCDDCTLSGREGCANKATWAAECLFDMLGVLFAREEKNALQFDTKFNSLRVFFDLQCMANRLVFVGHTESRRLELADALKGMLQKGDCSSKSIERLRGRLLWFKNFDRGRQANFPFRVWTSTWLSPNSWCQGPVISEMSWKNFWLVWKPASLLKSRKKFLKRMVRVKSISRWVECWSAQASVQSPCLETTCHMSLR